MVGLFFFIIKAKMSERVIGLIVGGVLTFCAAFAVLNFQLGSPRDSPRVEQIKEIKVENVEKAENSTKELFRNVEKYSDKHIITTITTTDEKNVYLWKKSICLLSGSRNRSANWGYPGLTKKRG